jgi:hypothetical protein
MQRILARPERADALAEMRDVKLSTLEGLLVALDRPLGSARLPNERCALLPWEGRRIA